MQFRYCHKGFKKLFLLLSMFGFSAFSQIVNVENLRQEKDTIGWSGHAKVNFTVQKNQNSIVEFSNELRIQHQGEKSLWLFINDIKFKEINAADIVNNNTQHLRFSHTLSSKTSFESFFQLQTDRVSEIKTRALLGSGLRFNLYNCKKHKVFLGTTVMYEHENSTDEVFGDIKNDIRNSIYLSFKLKPTENINIISANYFQPKMEHFSDFRILSETLLLFKIVKNLKFSTSFTYLFDSFPATNVVKVQFKLANGLVYFFD